MTIKTVTTYLAVRNAAAAIDFYKAGFGAEEPGERYLEPDRRIGHAELLLGDNALYISDEAPDLDVFGPESRGGATSSVVLEVDDPDALFRQAISAGATVDRPVTDSPHGRMGWLRDPYGHRWCTSGPVGSD